MVMFKIKIDWPNIAWRPARSISAIFRTSSSLLYKNYIEMMEGMYYPGQRFLTVTEKSMKNWVGMNNFVFFSISTIDVFRVHGTLHSPDTLPNMIYGQAFHIKTWQPPTERTPLLATSLNQDIWKRLTTPEAMITMIMILCIAPPFVDSLHEDIGYKLQHFRSWCMTK